MAEHPRAQQCMGASHQLSVVANGSGVLGKFRAFGVRGYMSLGGDGDGMTSPAEVQASFSDGSPAIMRRTVGLGSASHFAFLPGVHFHGIDPFHAAPDFNNLANFTDGSWPYVASFLARAGVVPRVRVSVQQVEAPLLSSACGAVVTLLNWRGRAVPPPLELSVLLDFEVGHVSSVNGSREISFSSEAPRPGSPEPALFRVNVSVTTTLHHGDFLLLHAKTRP